VPTEFWNWGYNCCFFLNFVPLHIESPYNFEGTGPILGVKNPLQRVNGNAVLISSRSVNKHSCHRQFLFLVGWFLKIFFSETAYSLAKWTETWWEAPMEGSVLLSFLKAEWKVSDTASAHWASSLELQKLFWYFVKGR
jgi:hypothetical protein